MVTLQATECLMPPTSLLSVAMITPFSNSHHNTTHSNDVSATLVPRSMVPLPLLRERADSGYLLSSSCLKIPYTVVVAFQSRDTILFHLFLSITLHGLFHRSLRCSVPGVQSAHAGSLQNCLRRKSNLLRKKDDAVFVFMLWGVYSHEGVYSSKFCLYPKVYC